MARVVLIQGSLSKESRTAIVLNTVAKKLKELNLPARVLDLREMDMEFCDGRSLKDYSVDLQKAHKAMEEAEAFVFGMPVYCFSISGPLKNFIDITSGAMEKKFAGIVCNAGGNRSYMASSDLMHVLAYECHVTTVQPVVYSQYEDFEGGALIGELVRHKIDEMVQALAGLLDRKTP